MASVSQKSKEQDVVLLSAKQDKGNEDKPEEAVRSATSIYKGMDQTEETRKRWDQ